MSDRTCGTCKHWLGDSWDDEGACGIDAAKWATHLREKRGYGASVPESVVWALDHVREYDKPACKRWKKRERRMIPR